MDESRTGPEQHLTLTNENVLLISSYICLYHHTIPTAFRIQSVRHNDRCLKSRYIMLISGESIPCMVTGEGERETKTSSKRRHRVLSKIVSLRDSRSNNFALSSSHKFQSFGYKRVNILYCKAIDHGYGEQQQSRPARGTTSHNFVRPPSPSR